MTIHQIYVPWRYLIITVPGFILAMTYALFQIKYSTVKITILVLFMTLFLITAKQTQKSYFKVGMKSVAEYIEQNSKPDDFILLLLP